MRSAGLDWKQSVQSAKGRSRPHDHGKHFATNCYVTALYGNCKGVRLRRIFGKELIELTLFGLILLSYSKTIYAKVVSFL